MADRFPPRYATIEDSVLEFKESRERLPYVHDSIPGGNLAKFANLEDQPLTEGEDGYLYVRARAISSRVNKNNDGWPSDELARAYKSFVGRPIFVDHKNDDYRRTRGVIVDSRLHVEDEKTSALDPYYATAPDNHKPPTWIELLMEVDAKTYPELAKDIREGKVTATSMGANIERSVCSVCNNEASSPSQYCDHIKSKGATFEIVSDNGETISKKAYEDCFGVNFFEDSFVFDPADETALISEKVGQKTATPVGTNDTGEEDDRKRNHIPQSDLVGAPSEVDTLRDELLCKNCEADHYVEDSDGVMRCPTCSDPLEPAPLDNPDLTRVERERAEEEDMGADADDEVTFTEQETSDSDFISPIEPIKPAAAVGVIGEMKFKTTFETDSQEEIEKRNPVTSAVQETLVGWPGGIHGGTHAALAQAGLAGSVTYPSGNTLPLPDERPNRHFGEQIRYKRENGMSDLSQVPVSLDFPDEQIEQAVAIIHAGGGRVAASQGKRVIKPGSKPADQPKDEKVLTDQHAPVEASKLTIKEDTDMEKEADRRKIVRTESPDGTKSEEIVEESGDLTFAEQNGEEPKKEAPKAEPKSDEAPEGDADDSEEKDDDKEESKSDKKALPFAASTESNLLTIFALADEAVEMNLVDKDEKLNFVAKLESETPDQLEARKDTMQMVKNAGLTKQPKVAGLRAFPKAAGFQADSSVNGAVDLKTIDDAAIFL
jgi:hypothetical protein